MKSNELIMIIGPMWSFKTTTLNKMIDQHKKNNKVFVFAPEGTQREERPYLKEAIGIKWVKNIKNDEQKDTLPLIASEHDFIIKLSKELNIPNTGKLENKNVKEELIRNICDELAKDNVWIAVDEIHFFEKGISEVLGLIREKGCNLIVAGLSVNYTSRLFETPHTIAQYATRIIDLKSSCSICHKPCRFYIKKIGFNDVIGGEGVYEPRCYKHFILKSKSLRW